MGIDVNFKKLENYDADKVAHKKVLGIEVLNSSQKKQVYKGHDEISDAQDTVDDAEYAVEDDESDYDDALTTEDAAEEQVKDAESKVNESPTTEDLDNTSQIQEDSGAVAVAYSEELEEMISSSEETSEAVLENMTVDSEEIASANSELEQVSAEVDEIAAQMEAFDTCDDSSQNSSDGMGGFVDEGFDGTGSGTSSAYSLSTGAESAQDGSSGTVRAPKRNTANNNPQDGSSADETGENSEAKSSFDALAAQYSEKSSQASELQARITSSSENINTQNEEIAASMEEQSAYGNDVISEGEEALTATDKAREVFTYGKEAGEIIGYAGTATKFIGRGLGVAGTFTEAYGAGLQAGGTVLQAVSGGLHAVAAPLMAVFGIGAVPEAAAITTQVSGISLTSGGVTAMTAGANMITAGETTTEVGRGISIVGNGVKSLSMAGLTGCDIADGNWQGALTNAFGAVASGLACAGDAMAMAGPALEAAGKAADYVQKIAKAGDVMNKVSKGFDMANGAINTGMAIAEGNTEGAILSGLGTFASGLSFGSGNVAMTGQIISGSVGIYSGSKSAKQAIESGDAWGAIKGIWGAGTSAVSTFGAASKLDLGKDSNGNVRENKLGAWVDNKITSNEKLMGITWMLSTGAELAGQAEYLVSGAQDISKFSMFNGGYDKEYGTKNNRKEAEKAMAAYNSTNVQAEDTTSTTTRRPRRSLDEIGNKYKGRN